MPESTRRDYVTVEGVLITSGHRKGLYHPKYFKDVATLISYMTLYPVYLYGYCKINNNPTSVILDCKKFIKSISFDDFEVSDRYIRFNRSEVDKSWIVTDRTFPGKILPQYGKISDTESIPMTELRERFLHFLDERTPKYVSIDQLSNDSVSVYVEGASEDLYLKQHSPAFSSNNSIFFVNGLCCMPEVRTNADGEYISLRSGRSYGHNMRDRNRGVVVVDFSKLCNVRYVELSSRTGDLSDISMPTWIDQDNHSVLLVIDGRLFLPNEFAFLSRTDVDKNGLVLDRKRSITFDTTKFRVEYSVDAECCKGNFIGARSHVGKLLGDTTVDVTRRLFPTRSISATIPDLKASRNSFAIILDRSGLNVVEHQCQSGTVETQFVGRSTTGSAMTNLVFGSESAGLLFDRSTRSVVDYMKEDNDQSFITTGSTIPLVWKTQLLRIHHCTPIEIWAKNNNDMSASASMHDNKTVRGGATVIWPRFTMLDFIFEG